MRNYVIINGVNSLTIQGLAIKTMPPITKPIQRNLREEIDGRDGDIVTTLGYGAYDKTIEIGLFGTFDIDEVIAYFNQKGTITFSNEADKVYYFEALDQVDYAELLKFRTANVVLHCQPFKYPLNETPLEEEYEYVTGTGTDITLDNTEETEFNEIELQGNTSQQTYTGKNLFSGNISQFDNQGGEGTTYTYFKLDENKTYTLSATAKDNITVATNHYIGMTYNGGNATGSYTWLISQGQTFTKGQKATLTSNQNRRFISAYSTTQANLDYLMENFDIMLEESATATDFEPYVGGIPSPNPNYPQDIHVVSGDNVVEITGRNLINMVETNKAVNNQGVISGNNSIYLGVEDYIDVKPNTTYTIQFEHDYAIEGNIANLYVGEKKKDGTFIGRTGFSQNRTFTTGNETYSIFPYLNRSGWEWTEAGGYLELEYGSQRHEYEPYTGETYPLNLGNLEMASIPNTDYKDIFVKDGETWYKREAVGKVVFDGTESWTFSTNGNAWYVSGWATPNNAKIPSDNSLKSNSLSKYFVNVARNELGGVTNGIGIASSGAVNMKHQDYSSDGNQATDFKAWLGVHNPSIYYILNNPTDTEITDETLASQLEALWNATSYRGQTNITQVSNDLPFMMEVSALKLGSDHLEINNTGNIYSKPTIELEGTGIVDIYLNDVQVFEVDLSEENKITIDTEKMEAYTDIGLANRKVTGDYSTFKLNVGTNDLRFSGALTSATITRYLRWL